MTTRTPSQTSVSAYKAKQRRRLKGMGLWQDPFVPSEPVRQHLRKIHEATGMPFYAISEKIGLPHGSSLQPLLWGRGKHGPSEKVSRETAELVLAYWPSMDDLPDTTLIDATGTVRRVEALAVQGWSRNWVGRQVGMREDNFRKALSKSKVTVGLARRVVAVYDQWWNQDPLDHGLALNPVSRTRHAAQRAGFYGPLAWDDDTIDNPNAMPMTDAMRPAVTDGANVADRWLMGESVILGPEDRKKVVQYLMEWTNDTPEEIAAQLEISLDALWQMWSRIKKKSRMEGRTEPWRRVYVPRERDLMQNEMEEAA